MGTKLRFYKKLQDGPIQPPLIDAPKAGTSDIPPLEMYSDSYNDGINPPRFGIGIPPIEHWDCDVLEEEGIRRLQAVVDEIVRNYGPDVGVSRV
jgi:hypothetical protein